MTESLLPQELADELSAILGLFVEHPPFLKDQSDGEKFGRALAESPLGLVYMPLLLDIVKDWTALCGKALMTYGMLGVTLS